MSEHDFDLEKTTQTDLLYGLVGEARSGVATLEAPSHRDSNEATDEDAVLRQHAATRADSSLSHYARATRTGYRKGQRWSYPEGGLAPPPSLPAIVVTESPRTLAVAMRSLWHGSYAWLFSLLLHSLLLPGLALLAYPERDTTRPVYYTVRHPAVSEPLDVIDVTAVTAIPAHFEAPFAEPKRFEVALPDTRLDRGGMQGMSPEMLLVHHASRYRGPVSDVQGLLAREGQGKAQSGSGDGGAEFFGTKASGNRFVFVVDCSMSMAERDRWPEAATELCAAIDRLTPQQLFYVILFDGGVHRMFDHDERQAALFPATEENKERFRAWLSTIRLGYDTRPFLSVKSALDLYPDAIYLLSDGDFKDPTAEYLKKYNNITDNNGRPRPQVVVHTFNFHNREGAAIMRRIARENGGKYVYLPPR
jgi:hypothetical protein